MSKFVLIFCITSNLFFISGCKEKGCVDILSISYDEKAEKDDGSCEYGGLGGSTTINAFPVHHDSAIISTMAYPDTVYVKFNAINLPGTQASNYDLVLVGDDGEDQIHIPNLKRGKYFIYMTGWDPRISRRVFGGIPYVLEQSSGTVNVVVPVTES